VKRAHARQRPALLAVDGAVNGVDQWVSMNLSRARSAWSRSNGAARVMGFAFGWSIGANAHG
jgi:hypothetical protein